MTNMKRFVTFIVFVLGLLGSLFVFLPAGLANEFSGLDILQSESIDGCKYNELAPNPELSSELQSNPEIPSSSEKGLSNDFESDSSSMSASSSDE